MWQRLGQSAASADSDGGLKGMGSFTHLTEDGQAVMVDVSQKTKTDRSAVVAGQVKVSDVCLQSMDEEAIREIVTSARMAAIQGSKRTAELIPLCHQVPLTNLAADIQLQRDSRCFTIQVTARATAVTGVEMEALIGASIAGATIYDMVKAIDPWAQVGPFLVQEKYGGKNSPWLRSASAAKGDGTGPSA